MPSEPEVLKATPSSSAGQTGVGTPGELDGQRGRADGRSGRCSPIAPSGGGSVARGPALEVRGAGRGLRAGPMWANLQDRAFGRRKRCPRSSRGRTRCRDWEMDGGQFAV